MCEIETVLIVANVLLAAMDFCIYQLKSGKKLGHNSHLESGNLFAKEYKKYCLNGGECDYLVEEHIVACNGTWLYGGKRCEK